MIEFLDKQAETPLLIFEKQYLQSEVLRIYRHRFSRLAFCNVIKEVQTKHRNNGFCLIKTRD